MISVVKKRHLQLHGAPIRLPNSLPQIRVQAGCQCLKALEFFREDYVGTPPCIRIRPAGRKNRIALALAFAHNPPMLARVLSAAVNGIEAFPVEVEVNCGWGDTMITI